MLAETYQMPMHVQFLLANIRMRTILSMPLVVELLSSWLCLEEVSGIALTNAIGTIADMVSLG